MIKCILYQLCHMRPSTLHNLYRLTTLSTASWSDCKGSKSSPRSIAYLYDCEYVRGGRLGRHKHTAVSNGNPTIAISKAAVVFSRHRSYGRWEKERGPENGISVWAPYLDSQVTGGCNFMSSEIASWLTVVHWSLVARQKHAVLTRAWA